MSALLSVLETIGIFLAGLVVRFGILAVVLIALTAIFLVGLGVVRLAAALRRRALGLGTTDGLSWKRHAYYAPGHTWLEALGNNAFRLGFDDLAQRVLGRVTAIALQKPGATVKEGQLIAEVMCGERRALIPSPVSGTIVAANDVVMLDPSAVHRDPYGKGWLFTLQPANAAYTRLLYGDPASRWLREESSRLRRFFEQELQLHAADGGELTAPETSLLDEQQWQAMAKSFLNVK